MKHAYEIVASFHHHESLSVHKMLNLLQKFSSRLEALSPNLRDWLLAGETKEEALMYEVFKNGEPTTAALAVLETNLKGKHDPRIVTIWNGLDGHQGASLRFIGRPEEYSSLVTFVGRPKSFSSDWQAIVQVMKAGVAIWHPDYITLESNGFYDHRTFEDRPGVGWMLYLPKILTSREVPEARALIPVTDEKKQPIGTIIVSVIDEPFSDENPDHIRAANAIEIRLADLDILPRFSDF